MPSFYEFFAGGGMARAGLGKGWKCLFANDIDPKKASSYAENWGGSKLKVGDVAGLRTADIPGRADLAWASFPCQDLSLAGNGAGLEGGRSGAFWPFWEHIRNLGIEGRAPHIVVLENVRGILSSHGGRDFAAIANELVHEGYRLGAVVIDAAAFLPQSRPRVFIAGVRAGLEIPHRLERPGPDPLWHPAHLCSAHEKLSPRAKSAWIWWNLPEPARRADSLADVLESEPASVNWHTAAETQRLLSMMSPVNRAKVEAARATGRPVVGTIYRRIRQDKSGERTQRAEVRFDNIAGCLRTPAGGSSRQTVLIVEGDRVRSRLLSPREVIRLMGLPDDYRLPKNYNEAYHLAGDGVAVPVVRFLAANLLEPVLQ